MSKLQTLKLEAENIIIGQLLDNKHIGVISENLTENDFNNQICRIIFKAVTTLADKKEDINLPTVFAEAKKISTNVAMSHLNGIINNFYCLKDISYYIKLLKDLNERLSLINNLKHSIETVDDLTINTDEIKVDIATTIENSIKAEAKGVAIEDATNEFFDMIEHYMTNQNTDMLFKLNTLNYETGGLSDAVLMTIGARSGVGKTSFVLDTVDGIAKKKKVLFFSLEMKKGQLIAKLMSKYTGIGLVEIKRGLQDESYQKVIQAIGMTNDVFKNLVIDDQSRSIREIKLAIRKHKPDLVVIDYLQLLRPVDPRETRERQVATLSREIKEMTMKFDIPIIQLTQLNSDQGDNRPHGEVPMRESKAIYHDSNVVIYLHRPNEKDLEQIKKENQVSEQGMQHFTSSGCELIEVILDKQREGGHGKIIRTWFNGKLSSYNEIPRR